MPERRSTAFPHHYTPGQQSVLTWSRCDARRRTRLTPVSPRHCRCRRQTDDQQRSPEFRRPLDRCQEKTVNSRHQHNVPNARRRTDAYIGNIRTSRQHLRSTDIRKLGKLVVRRTRTVLGARDSAVSCAVVWNTVPTDLEFYQYLLLYVRQTLTCQRLTCFLARFSASGDYYFALYKPAHYYYYSYY